MKHKSHSEQTKLDYLYAFEAAFSAKCKAAGINAGRWAQGMWTSAHMHHGQGNSVEEGVKQWFAHVSTHSLHSK